MYFISFSRPQAGEEPGCETVSVLISQAKLITIINVVQLFFLCTPDKSVNKFESSLKPEHEYFNKIDSNNDRCKYLYNIYSKKYPYLFSTNSLVFKYFKYETQ